MRSNGQELVPTSRVADRYFGTATFGNRAPDESGVPFHLDHRRAGLGMLSSGLQVTRVILRDDDVGVPIRVLNPKKQGICMRSGDVLQRRRHGTAEWNRRL